MFVVPQINYATLITPDLPVTALNSASHIFRSGDSVSEPFRDGNEAIPNYEINLSRQGTAAIHQIGIGTSFDIYVEDSSDANDVIQVRFSSDDSLDGSLQEAWTQWYDWNTSEEDWNAITKAKTWDFTTGGYKEIWIEKKGADGNSHTNIVNVRVYVPILLVHGFQRGDIPTGYWDLDVMWQQLCKDFTGKDPKGPENIDWKRVYEDSNQDINYSMKRLEGNGYVVYISNYSHSQSKGTHDTIENYARELVKEIDIIKQYDNVSKVDIVAHSMGGLISRTYIENDGLIATRYRGDVRKLIMMGTPNRGVSRNLMAKLFGVSIAGLTEYLAIPQMFSDSIYSDFLDILNSDNNGSDAPGVEYTGIAGNVVSSGSGRDGDGPSGIAVESVYLPEIPRTPDRWLVLRCNHNALLEVTGSILKDIVEGNSPKIPKELCTIETYVDHTDNGVTD